MINSGMNSKFLSICEQVKRTLNEQGLGASIGSEDQTQMPMSEPSEQPQMPEPTGMTSDEQSELPVVSNKEIVSAVKSIKNFYSKKKDLNPNDIERIQMLSDDESDENIKKIIKTLNNIFNPVDTIDTNPKNVPNSDFEK
jgi:hypothetical protein